MTFEALTPDHQVPVTDLVRQSFTIADNEHEGAIVSKLASELTSQIDGQTILGLGHFASNRLLGVILFSQLTFPDDSPAYLLAPLAVHPEHHGSGIGSGLVHAGLEKLRTQTVDLAVTYGDPAFYGRLGFQPLSETVVPAPFALSMPHGWQGLSPGGGAISPRWGKPRCAAAFDHPDLW